MGIKPVTHTYASRRDPPFDLERWAKEKSKSV
jgi:hypothetical protein